MFIKYITSVLFSIIVLGYNLSAQVNDYSIPYQGANTVSSCAANLYDNGGASNNFTLGGEGLTTIYPSEPNGKIKLFFESIDLSYYMPSWGKIPSEPFTSLSIYNGIDTSAPLLASYTSIPSYSEIMTVQKGATYYATNPAGALTVKFIAKGKRSASGFSAKISCETPSMDIMIDSIQILNSKEIHYQYDELDLRVEFSNMKPVTPNPFTVKVILSKDTLPSSNDIFFASTTVTLAGEENDTVLIGTNFTGSGRTNLTPGDYYVLVMLDYEANVYELNRNNNIKFIPLTVYKNKPDLKWGTINNIATIAKGDTLKNVNLSLLNMGNQIFVPHRSVYFLSSDTLLDGFDTSIGFDSVGGNLVYQSSSIVIPKSTMPGNYYIIFVADYLNVNDELNENNNIIYKSVTITNPTVDAIIQSVGASTLKVIKGTPFSVYTTVKNTGSTSFNNNNLVYYVSTDTLIDQFDVILGTSMLNSVAGNDLSNHSLAVIFPDTLQAGAYYLIVKTDYDNQVSESNENNNVGYVPIAVLNRTYDLTSQLLRFKTMYGLDSAKGDVYVDLKLRVFNYGNANSPSGTINVYLSSDSTIDAADIRLFSETIGSFLCDNSDTNNTTLYRNLLLPKTVMPGKYYVLSSIDDNNQIHETNENNNVTNRVVTFVNIEGDFSLDSLFFGPAIISDSVYFKDYFQGRAGVNFRIRRSGTFNWVASASVFISKDTILDQSDIYLSETGRDTDNSAYSNFMNTHQSYRYSCNFNNLNDFADGYYYFIVKVDHQNNDAEINENNNILVSDKILFAQAVILNENIQSTTTCNAKFLGVDYAKQYLSMTIYPDKPENFVKIRFSDGNAQPIDLNSDASYVMKFYDGTSIDAPLLYVADQYLPSNVMATNPEGAITISYQTESFYNSFKFIGDISCLCNEKASKHIYMYPNPLKNNELLQLYMMNLDKNKPYVATIYDVNGSVLHSFSLTSSASGEVFETIPMYKINTAGMYFVKLTGDRVQEVVKLFVE
jgi:subtilase family serine protease